LDTIHAPKFIEDLVQGIGHKREKPVKPSTKPATQKKSAKKSWSEKSWSDIFFSRHMTEEEKKFQELQWLVESGAVRELAGVLLEFYLYDINNTTRDYIVKKMVRLFYLNQEAYRELERKAAQEIVNGSKPVYQLLLLKPEDKIALLNRLNDAPKFDTDDIKMKSKWFNRFRNVTKNLLRSVHTFFTLDWMKSLTIPFAALSIASNLFNMVLDMAAVGIDLKRTFNTRFKNEGVGPWLRGALLENGRLYNIIDSASSWMSSLTTIVLELAFGLGTVSLIVGLVFTAFDAAFTIWGNIVNTKMANAKIDYLKEQLGAIEKEIAHEEAELKEREILDFQRVRYLQEHLLYLQKAAEQCTNPEERRSLFRGKDNIIDTINELEEKKSKNYSDHHRELLRHRKNFKTAIHKEKTALVRAHRDTMVNMFLFGLIMVSVVTLQFSFPAGAVMLAVCAVAKAAWKIYQRARDMGGFKAMLMGVKAKPPEQLLEEEALAQKCNGHDLLLSDEMRMQAHVREALEARNKAHAIPGWDDEDILRKAGLTQNCKEPGKISIDQRPEGGSGGGVASPAKSQEPSRQAYLKLTEQVARADEKRPSDKMHWLYEDTSLVARPVVRDGAGNPEILPPPAYGNPAAVVPTHKLTVPTHKLTAEMTLEKRHTQIAIADLVRGAVAMPNSVASPAA